MKLSLFGEKFTRNSGIVELMDDLGSALLENPDMISKAVLARRLDSQTAFEIVSIDIADIDVGDNIGARLQADQAEADTRVARAQAEGRRAMAVSTSIVRGAKATITLSSSHRRRMAPASGSDRSARTTPCSSS